MEFLNDIKNKYNAQELNIITKIIDDLYLNYTKEQIIEKIILLYDNADNIYNELKRENKSNQ